MLDNATPEEVQVLRLTISIASLVVAIALGWVVAKQAKGYRYASAWGVFVGLTCFLLLLVIGEPFRAKLARIECKSERVDKDSYQACLEDGYFGPPDDRQD